MKILTMEYSSPSSYLGPNITYNLQIKKKEFVIHISYSLSNYHLIIQPKKYTNYRSLKYLLFYFDMIRPH